MQPGHVRLPEALWGVRIDTDPLDSGLEAGDVADIPSRVDLQKDGVRHHRVGEFAYEGDEELAGDRGFPCQEAFGDLRMREEAKTPQDLPLFLRCVGDATDLSVCALVVQDPLHSRTIPVGCEAHALVSLPLQAADLLDASLDVVRPSWTRFNWPTGALT